MEPIIIHKLMVTFLSLSLSLTLTHSSHTLTHAHAHTRTHTHTHAHTHTHTQGASINHAQTVIQMAPSGIILEEVVTLGVNPDYSNNVSTITI